MEEEEEKDEEEEKGGEEEGQQQQKSIFTLSVLLWLFIGSVLNPICHGLQFFPLLFFFFFPLLSLSAYTHSHLGMNNETASASQIQKPGGSLFLFKRSTIPFHRRLAPGHSWMSQWFVFKKRFPVLSRKYQALAHRIQASSELRGSARHHQRDDTGT